MTSILKLRNLIRLVKEDDRNELGMDRKKVGRDYKGMDWIDKINGKSLLGLDELKFGLNKGMVCSW